MNKEELLKQISEVEGKDLEQELNLRGKLISIIKDEIKQSDKAKKTLLEGELIEQTKKHKDVIKKLKEDNNKIIDIPKRVGLTVKEISDTIRVFLKEKDVVGRLKQAGISTSIGTLISAAISIGLTAISGPITLATLASVVPTACYLGLSNLIGTFFNKTPKGKLLEILGNKEKIGKEASEFANQYIMNNINLLELLKRKSNIKDNNDGISVYHSLIDEYNNIIEKAPSNEIKNALKNDLLDNMIKLKECLEKKKYNYIKDKEKLSVSEFNDLEKSIINLDVKIFELQNNVKESTKLIGKKICANTVMAYTSRLVLSSIFPSLAFTDALNALTPLLYSTMGVISNSDKLKNSLKLVPSKYTEQIIKLNNPDLFNQLFENNNEKVAMAM